MEGYRPSRSGTRTHSQNQPKSSTHPQKSSNTASSSSLATVSKGTSPKAAFSKTSTTKTQSSTSVTPSGTSTRISNTEISKERGRSKRHQPSKKEDDDKTVKNPELVQPEKSVDNEDLINGLALQRQWDEKPDIDHLSTSLLNLYQKLESQEDSNFGELRAKIFLSSLRVRSKSLGFLNFTHNKLKCIIRFCRYLNLKYNSLNHNVPRIERHYLKLCRFYQKRKSLNEVYERLSRIACKLPNLNQVQLTSKDLIDKKLKALAKMEKVKEQIELQKSQINDITKLMSDLTSNPTTSSQ